MILEGIVTTRREDGSPHLAPMGPAVEDNAAGDLRRFTLKPFQGSTTLSNLLRERAGVLHVTDDVLLLAQAAIGQAAPLPQLVTVGEILRGNRAGESPPAAPSAKGFASHISSQSLTAAPSDLIRAQFVVADTVRWYAFHVVDSDTTRERAVLTAEVVAHGRVRDFFGFNRAKHAVVEAAILATRVDLLLETDIRGRLTPLQSAVEKTGGQRERTAFALLINYLEAAWAKRA